MLEVINGRSAQSKICAYCLSLILIDLTGCGVHFHNSENEAQARKANDSFVSADLGKYIDTERQVLQTTNERNIIAIRRHSAAERDRLIAFALTKGIKVVDIKQKIDDRMDIIGFPNDEPSQKALNSLHDTLSNALVSRDRYLVITANLNGISPPSFPPSDADEKAANQTGNEDIKSIFNNYKTNSDKYLNTVLIMNGISNGKIGKLKKQEEIDKLNQQLVKIGELETHISQEISIANQKLKSSIQQYQKVLADGKKTSEELKSYQKKIEDALDEFDKIVLALEPDAKKLGIEDLLAEARLEQLKAGRDQVGQFLASYSKAESDKTSATSSTNASNAEIAGKVASIVVRMTKEIQDSSAEAKLVPLMFEQQRLRLELARMQRMYERGKKRISLVERQRDAFVAEGIKLMDAKKQLKKASDNNDSVLLETLFNNEKKEDLLKSIIQICQSIATDKRHEQEIEVALITLDHDEALDSSEFSLGLWKIMIASPLEQLVSYHTSGITSDDVSKLLQAVSLAGIAVGVNR